MTKFSSEEILVFPFACAIFHNSKFDSFACAFQVTTFDICTCEETFQEASLISDLSFVREVVRYVVHDALRNQYRLCKLVLLVS